MPKISELASASGSVNFTTVVPIVENATTKKVQIPSLLSTVYKNAGSFNWVPARTPAGGSSYNQTEIQNLRTLIVETRQALLAIQQDLIAHGLIGT